MNVFRNPRLHLGLARYPLRLRLERGSIVGPVPQDVFDWLRANLGLEIELYEYSEAGGECRGLKCRVRVVLTNPTTGLAEVVASAEATT